MDAVSPPIPHFGTAAAPLIVALDPDPGGRRIAGALRRPADMLDAWAREVAGRPVVVCDARGKGPAVEVSGALRAKGIDAAPLAGGLARWRELGLPTRLDEAPSPRAWITRERPKIDRIACPWLVRRFVDPFAEFAYVPASDVLATAARTGAVAYDIAGAEPFHHAGELCSFDAFLRVYGVDDPALEKLAAIVRGADTGRPGLTPQSPGLLAISQGLSKNFPDDHAMLEAGMHVYDALYAWCRQ